MSRIQYRMGDALSMTIFSTSSFNKLGVPPGAPPKQQPDYHRLDTLLSIDNQQAVQLQQQPLEESSASAGRISYITMTTHFLIRTIMPYHAAYWKNYLETNEY